MPAALQTLRFGPLVRRRGALLPWSCLMGVDSHSQGIKEYCGCCRCVTAHRVLICSEEGDPIRIFFIPPHRGRAFSKGPVVIQCISEIKASPHSCLMLTASWKNCLWVDLGGSFPTLLLYLLYRPLSSQPHTLSDP